MTRLRALAVTVALTACGSDPAPPAGPDVYTLTGAPPTPEQLTVGDRVRTLILRVEDRAGADHRQTACAMTALLFDVTAMSTVVPAGIDASSDCRFYATPPETDWQRQRGVCAGAINVSSAALMDTVGYCPNPGARLPIENALTSCGALAGDRHGDVSSMDEGIPGDVVTDLAGRIELPTAVQILGPSDLPVFTWPASGDLEVTWRSTGATSAVVRIDAVTGEANTGPAIICRARQSGRVTVPQALLAQANFRANNARLRVWSYRDRTVTAEQGMTWRLVGATGSSMLLQGRSDR